MVIVITYNCNLLCPHCAFSCDKNGKHMGEATFDRAIDFFNSSGSRHLQISGGEPTRHPHFIRFMKKALARVNGKNIYLLSNGQFLYDKILTRTISSMQKKYGFEIQVTAVPGLYRNAEKTAAKIKKRAKLFDPKKTYYINQMTVIDPVGRAKGKDFSFLGPLYKRTAPACFNQFNLASHDIFKSFPNIIRFVEDRTQFNKCKPLIGPNGDVYPGENNLCHTDCNVNTSTIEDYYNFLKNHKPCGSCVE